MKQKVFFKIFQVARYCLRPETALLTVLAIKRGLLCNFAKTFKGRRFMGHSGTVLKFSIINSKSPNLSSNSLLKNILKIPVLDLKKRGYLVKF